jgi:hypothetical protein
MPNEALFQTYSSSILMEIFRKASIELGSLSPRRQPIAFNLASLSLEELKMFIL